MYRTSDVDAMVKIHIKIDFAKLYSFTPISAYQEVNERLFEMPGLASHSARLANLASFNGCSDYEGPWSPVA